MSKQSDGFNANKFIEKETPPDELLSVIQYNCSLLRTGDGVPMLPGKPVFTLHAEAAMELVQAVEALLDQAAKGNMPKAWTLRRKAEPDPDDEISYKDWMFLVNKHLNKRLGVGVYDIADQMWRSAYDNGETPWEAITGFFGDPEEIGDEEFMRNVLMGGE